MNKISPRFWQTAIIFMVVAGVMILAGSGYINSVISTASSPVVAIQRWITSRYVAVYEFVTVPRDMASLRQRNAELENEIAKLQTEIIAYEQQLKETSVLYALLDFARTRPENTYVAASVIGKDPSPFLQYIIIDKGTDDGIRHGMPVVSQQGLVGRVDMVIAAAARVQLITDAASSVNIQLGTAQISAILSGSVTGDVNIEMVPSSVSLLPGDLVLTSGLGGNYPPDIVIGQVVTVRSLENELFQSASVQPAVDFSTLQAVLVITNFKPVDISPLIPTPIP